MKDNIISLEEWKKKKNQKIELEEEHLNQPLQIVSIGEEIYFVKGVSFELEYCQCGSIQLVARLDLEKNNIDSLTLLEQISSLWKGDE